MRRHFKIKPLAAAIIASTLSATSVYAPPVFAQTDVQERAAHEDYYARTERHAAEAMVHLAKARAALHREDMTDARAELQFANTMIASVEENLPTYRLHRQIEVAKLHLSFSPPADVKQDLVPIWRSVDVLTDFLPAHVTDQYYAHIEAIQGSLSRAERERALKLLTELDNAVEYTEIDLPVYSIRRHVTNALTAMNLNDTKTADRLLKAAEDELLVTTTGTAGLPAYSVRDAVVGAEKHYKKGLYDKARSEIDKAIKLLSSTATSGSEQSRKYAEALLIEAEKLMKDIESKASGTEHRIRHLATQSHAFAQREYKLQHSMLVSSNLIEAEFHVTRAAADVELGRAVNEMQKGEASAREELIRAQAYLEDVHAESHVGEQITLKKVINEVKQLALAPAAEPSMMAFYKVERELSGLIRNASL